MKLKALAGTQLFGCPAGICKGKAFTNEAELSYNFGTIQAFFEEGNCVKSI